MRDIANINIVALLVPVLQPACLCDRRYRKLAPKSFAKERFLRRYISCYISSLSDAGFLALASEAAEC